MGYSNEKLNESLFLIGEHATTINIDSLNAGNIDLYNKLIKVQLCDASAYEPTHAKETIEQLNNIKRELDNKIADLNDFTR